MSKSTPLLESLEQSVGRTDATIKWARFLGETFGTTGALNCLRYYEDLGWISPLVREQRTSYLRGLSMGEIHNKRYDEPTWSTRWSRSAARSSALTPSRSSTSPGSTTTSRNTSW